jgi:hypothetical protein
VGKRGPAPKPTALRVLHGDRTDRINGQEAVPPEKRFRHSKPPNSSDNKRFSGIESGSSMFEMTCTSSGQLNDLVQHVQARVTKVRCRPCAVHWPDHDLRAFDQHIAVRMPVRLAHHVPASARCY